MTSPLYERYQQETGGGSLYARYQREQTARAAFADQGREGPPVPVDPSLPVSPGLGPSLARGGQPRTVLQEAGHALSGVVAEPALEGLVQAGPFLMGAAHAIPAVGKAVGQYLANPQDIPRVLETLDQGKAAREAATAKYAGIPLYGAGPSTNTIAAALRARLGQPETPTERAFGNVSMLATPVAAEMGVRAGLSRAATVASDAAAAGLRGPLTVDQPLPVELPPRDFPAAGEANATNRAVPPGVETLTGVASKNRATNQVISQDGFDGGHSALPGVPYSFQDRQVDWVDGFVTSTGRFVNRMEALEIAKSRNQLRAVGSPRLRGGGLYEGLGDRTRLEAGDLPGPPAAEPPPVKSRPVTPPNPARHADMKAAAPAEAAAPPVAREIQTEAPPFVGPAEDLTPLRRRFLAERAAAGRAIPEGQPVVPEGAPEVLDNSPPEVPLPVPTEAEVGYKKNPRSYTDEELARRYENIGTRLNDALQGAEATNAGTGSLKAFRAGKKFSGVRAGNDNAYMVTLRDEMIRRGIDPERFDEARATQLGSQLSDYRAAEPESMSDPLHLAPPRTVRGSLSPDVPFNPESGAGKLPVVTGLAGAGAGAAIGSQQDTDHPLRGALLGAIAGGALGARVGSRIEDVGTSPPMVRPKQPSVGALDAIKRTFAPQLRSAEAGQTGRIVRAQSGQAARDMEIARSALSGFRDQVGDLPKGNVPSPARDFIAAVEGGKAQPTPELTAAAQTARKLLDHWRTEIQNLGTGKLQHFITDYFPHIWDDPNRAGAAIAQATAKRPLEGSKSFLKQRTIPTIEDGLNAGLTPVTSNPMDLVLLKIHEMRKYVTGQRILQELDKAGLVQTIQAGDRMPPGTARVNDKLFQPGAVSRVVPEPVANVLNNYLSPGLRGNPIYDAYMGVANSLNMAQLGLSAFHAGFTSVDAIVSRVELAGGQAAAGRLVQSGKTLLGALAAPITTAIRGGKVLKAYSNPGQMGPLWEAIANQVAEAGGRAAMDPIYGAGKLHKALDPLGIMDQLVPRQKLGVFADLAKHEVERLGPNPTPDAVRGAVQTAWNSVDNRLGQMVYDNLFWNKLAKDAAHLTTRAVGWNLGTFRELGGGALDLARLRNTPKGRYVVALPLTVAGMGAMLHYLYNGTAPATLKDYFLVPTGRVDDEGNPERVQLPSYMKDVFSYGKHPVQTLLHKTQPMLGMIADMLQNEDFFGNQIRNAEDPLVQQAAQVGTYLGQSVIPFGVRNAMKQRESGQTLGTQAGSFVGLTPAGRDFTRTPAQSQLMDFRRQSKTSMTPEQQADAQRRGSIQQGKATGTISQEATRDSVYAGALTRKQAHGMDQRNDKGLWVSRFSQLPVEQAQRVYDLGSPDEQKAFYWSLMGKRRKEGLPPLPKP